jgi:hypothetical protein
VFGVALLAGKPKVTSETSVVTSRRAADFEQPRIEEKCGCGVTFPLNFIPTPTRASQVSLCSQVVSGDVAWIGFLRTISDLVFGAILSIAPERLCDPAMWMNHSVHLFLLSPRGFDAPSCSDAISQIDFQSATLLANAMRVFSYSLYLSSVIRQKKTFLNDFV